MFDGGVVSVSIGVCVDGGRCGKRRRNNLHVVISLWEN